MIAATTPPAMATTPAPPSESTFGPREAADLWFEAGDRSRSRRHLCLALSAYENAARKSEEARDPRRQIAAYLEVAAVLCELGRGDELPAVAKRLLEIAKEPKLPDGVLLQSVLFGTMAKQLPTGENEFLLVADGVRRARCRGPLEAIDDDLPPLRDDTVEPPLPWGPRPAKEGPAS